MATLESITRGASVKGIFPDGLVTISDVRWIGTVAIEVTYKDSAGRLGNELLYRGREPTLEIAEAGRPWSFDGDSALFRLLSEANRIRLAYLFDPLLAVHTSLVQPLPHQITAVYGELLSRQPLRFLLADDPGAGKTIMTGLFIRELIARGDLQRCLIVCPEMKGQVTGSKTVTNTKNEILTGLNKPNEFILTVVIIDQDSTEVRYCRTPFEKEPDFKATSVNYDLTQLLAQARELA
jgi:hypothetical protein